MKRPLFNDKIEAMARYYKQRAGFTLIEMIVVLAIMVALTAIGIANFPAIRSQIEVSLALHELQLSLRQAQAYAISVREFNPTFIAPICQLGVPPPARFPPYGVSITTVDPADSRDQSTYVIFADIACAMKVPVPPYIAIYNPAYSPNEVISTHIMHGGVKITSIVGTNGAVSTALDIADITYQRPSPSIMLAGHAGASWNSYEYIDITVANSYFTKTIRVRTSGQVSVQ